MPDDLRKSFPVILDEDETPGEILVVITDEGVIVDLTKDGEVIKTFGATAQELANDFCH